MPDAVEVAIESALLNRLNALTLSPAVPVSLPNITFVPPTAGQSVAWLRATFLPAATTELSVDYTGSNQHYGIFQVDVFYGQGGGELAPARIAAAVIQWFKRGTKLTKDGFKVEVTRAPRRGSLLRDDPWQMLPVSIPYVAYAPNPA
jgi:hypothetical protein